MSAPSVQGRDAAHEKLSGDLYKVLDEAGFFLTGRVVELVDELAAEIVDDPRNADADDIPELEDA
jgi:hypothetical protein